MAAAGREPMDPLKNTRVNVITPGPICGRILQPWSHGAGRADPGVAVAEANGRQTLETLE
jgi:hypothetical protein